MSIDNTIKNAMNDLSKKCSNLVRQETLLLLDGNQTEYELLAWECKEATVLLESLRDAQEKLDNLRLNRSK